MAPSDQSDGVDACEIGHEFRPYGSDHRQLDMFGSPPARSYDPDLEAVRSELTDILARARAAPQESLAVRLVGGSGWTPPPHAGWNVIVDRQT